MTIQLFNDDWKNWIWSNINNGVSNQRIYSDLIKNGFDQFLVINELRFLPPATAQGIITPPAVSTHLEQFGAEKLSDVMPLFKVTNFLSETECAEIIEIQKQHNTRSTTGQDDEIKIDKNSKIKNTRSPWYSYSVF
jgi:hypothetical protein